MQRGTLNRKSALVKTGEIRIKSAVQRYCTNDNFLILAHTKCSFGGGCFLVHNSILPTSIRTKKF